MIEVAGNRSDSKVRANRDVVALGIAAGSIILFVGTGGTALPQILRSWLGTGQGPSLFLINAVLLNIALIIFSWRRYREMLGELDYRRNAEELARKLADTDPLTGCLNRRSMGVQTAQMLEDRPKNGGEVAFLMIDLDNFKLVNDYYGCGPAGKRDPVSGVIGV